MKLLSNVLHMDSPLALTTIRDCHKHGITFIIVTESAFEETSHSVRDYAGACGITIAKEERENKNV